MADFPISSLPSGTLDSDSLLMVSTPDGLGGYDSEHVNAQQFAGIAVKRMTQTDYDNLTPTEKNNGTLYITDGTPPSEVVTGSDVLYFSDVSDSNKPKSTTAAAVAALGTLSDLSDVSITTPASGNSLVYDGTEWVNDTLDAADIPYSAGVSVADKLDSLDFETGTSGFFSYRKWNDGTLEIWGTRHVTGWTTSWSAWGNGFFTTISSLGTYPVAFIDYPNVTVTFQPKGGQAFAGLTDGNYSNILTQAPIVGVYRFTTDTGNLNEFVLSLYAKGRWKA